ncbi:hypothetical protein B0H14DRAFT_3142158 [Mycena olivaceomarginata]|nr:hypothetical protein B0H14DRAFT_3142158 [Mycena olivaceomarginata]
MIPKNNFTLWPVVKEPPKPSSDSRGGGRLTLWASLRNMSSGRLDSTNSIPVTSGIAVYKPAGITETTSAAATTSLPPTYTPLNDPQWSTSLTKKAGIADHFGFSAEIKRKHNHKAFVPDRVLRTIIQRFFWRGSDPERLGFQLAWYLNAAFVELEKDRPVQSRGTRSSCASPIKLGRGEGILQQRVAIPMFHKNPITSLPVGAPGTDRCGQWGPTFCNNITGLYIRGRDSFAYCYPNPLFPNGPHVVFEGGQHHANRQQGQPAELLRRVRSHCQSMSSCTQSFVVVVVDKY